MQTRVLADVTTEVASKLHERLRQGGSFGFPTGRTMDPIYARLVELHKQKPVRVDAIHAFMVDEYWGLDQQDPRSYHAYLHERVFAPLGIKHIHGLNIPGSDPKVSAAQYEESIRKVGGIDLQLLGLGQNGHIGFNEPGSAKDSHTRLVEIADATREANASLFNSKSEVPTHALSIGVGTIMAAKEVWIIASGSSKASIVAKVVSTQPTPDIPATFLRAHSKCTMFLDPAAAVQLS